ncbi:hypothetical protein BJV82DRAFT_341284 [Fennellomyces sp. T-0311]|nr:hypothetical protein BJV82DRAFT_341284 [Fennellomyces sp. T-0311]
MSPHVRLHVTTVGLGLTHKKKVHVWVSLPFPVLLMRTAIMFSPREPRFMSTSAQHSYDSHIKYSWYITEIYLHSISTPTRHLLNHS